jgi:hypothetical protein
LTSRDDRETSQERRAAALVEKFGEDYQTYQYAFVDFLVEHLTDLSRSYGGDFQQIMVLAIIGQRRLHARHDREDTGGSKDGAMAISASRLADVTGIPRETVRRKLALMHAKGWLTQGPDGSWSLAVDEGGRDLPVRRDHAAFDMRARWRIARLVAALERVGCDPDE